METLISKLWAIALSSDHGFFAGSAFVLLLIIYLVRAVVKVVGRVASDYLNPLYVQWLSKRKGMDAIEIAKEAVELEMHRHALELMKKTGEQSFGGRDGNK